MTNLEKKAQELANKAKRSGRASSSRTSKSSSTSSPISTPPKAAIAAEKSAKEDLHRRKRGMAEHLLKPSNPEPEPNSNTSNAEGVSAHPVKESDSTAGAEAFQAQSDRVAELEKALSLAHAEQKRSLEEIERLRRDEAGYRDAIDGYKRQLDQARNDPYGGDLLHMDFEREAERQRAWTKQRVDLQSHVCDLQDKVVSLHSEIIDRDARWKLQLDRERAEWTRERNHFAERVHAAEKEALGRRDQLMSLKTNISTMSRMENQLTDSNLVAKMNELYYRTREWALANFRRARLVNPSELSETSKTIICLLNPHLLLDPTEHKLAMFQAIASRDIVEILGDTNHIGVPDEGPLAQVRTVVDSLEASSAAYRKWRASTLDLTRNKIGEQSFDENTKRAVSEISRGTQRALSEITETPLSETCYSTYVSLLHEAVAISRAILFQNAKYVLIQPKIPSAGPLRFDGFTMEDVEGAVEDTSDDNPPVYLAVFPGLRKFGDEMGENEHLTNILLKARVVCTG